MISVSRAYRIASAHYLPHVEEGHKCRNPHGHTYRIVVTFIGRGPHNGLDDRGFVKDFAEIDAVVEPLLKLIDHKILNDAGIANPTAELIAIWIAAGTGADRVQVYENPDCWAEWSRDAEPAQDLKDGTWVEVEGVSEFVHGVVTRSKRP